VQLNHSLLIFYWNKTSLAGLHWLRAAKRIKFKMATLTSRCLHCAAPPRYLFAQQTRVTDMPSRRRLRSSATDALLVRPTRLVTVGDRAFPVAAVELWNELPSDFIASVSPTAFRRQQKTCMFRVSYPDSKNVLLDVSQLQFSL